MSLLPPRKPREDGEDPITQTQVMLQIAELLKTIQDNSNQSAQQQALLQAEMLVRAMPENKAHPGISAFSYPEGDLAREKPKLKCPIYWVGYPETVETLTPAEIEALNLLEPGEYTVTKGNSERIPFRVEAKKRMNGELESLSVSFPVKDDQRNDHRSKIEYCLEAMGRPVPTVAELQAKIAALQAGLRAPELTVAAD